MLIPQGLAVSFLLAAFFGDTLYEPKSTKSNPIPLFPPSFNPPTPQFAISSMLPPVFGLYTATLPPIFYTLFGTSRHLSVGPAALIAVFFPIACLSLGIPADPSDQEALARRVLAAPVLSFWVGVRTCLRIYVPTVLATAVWVRLPPSIFSFLIPNPPTPTPNPQNPPARWCSSCAGSCACPRSSASSRTPS